MRLGSNLPDDVQASEILPTVRAEPVEARAGGVYIFVAIVWLWAVDGVRPTPWDIAGAALALAGMGVIMFAPRSA
ncbi:Uncharacterised BCR, YnfA/UPF0060 family [Acidovorax soli]|uniref:Uncharacterized BCR, YnfA/UPF0060 family n=1 Tax=Acidovorax soli TaxID=592050 RepID=A0A1H3XQT0_9BURK|nr:hypothetical protein [Acidovorax soli]SEA01600.1 Uncharacterised BCR, YnfA/UPF0060 family [Acidovorax soli]